MKKFREFKNNSNLWSQVSFIVSISFLMLSVVLLVSGNNILKANNENVLHQRLIIAQLAAAQIDQSLSQTVNDLERTIRLADFDPDDLELDSEAEALNELYSFSHIPISEIVFVDDQGGVLLSHPPDRYDSGYNISSDSNLGQILQKREKWISTPYNIPPEKNTLIMISIPLYDGDSLRGWLGGVVDLDEDVIKAMLLDGVSLDQSAHAILVDDQGRALVSTFDLPFLSPGEHAVFYKRALSQGSPVIEEVPFELDLPDEPPGHMHIMAFAPLKTVPWGVSMGGDVIRETFAIAYRPFIGLAVFIIVSIIALWGITLIGTRRLLKPVQKTNLKFDISRKIANAKDWDELTSTIVRIPSTIIPIAGSRLLLRGDDSNITLEAEWAADGDEPIFPNLPQNQLVCDVCALIGNDGVSSFAPCFNRSQTTLFEQQDQSGPNTYCFPLVHQHSLIGTLQICLEHDVSISDDQLDVLKSAVSDMAIALQSAQLQKLNLKHAEITLAEQKRIFRVLHDTIGQNISYLHLKLDHYSNIDSKIGISEIQRDIERMRDIANQAYLQMRSMLTDLNPETQSDLVAALRSRAKSVAERAGFKFEMVIAGEPLYIPQHIKRHVLFICYEALNNIEQHAHANTVSCKFQWSEGGLTITFTDDGDGFIVGESIPGDHFGMNIMKDRVESINGRLAFASQPGKGTEVLLWIPLRKV